MLVEDVHKQKIAKSSLDMHVTSVIKTVYEATQIMFLVDFVPYQCFINYITINNT